MSNPGVIVLANLSSKNTNFNRFQIEDNIGESIHLHVDNIRLDLSVSEFLDLSCMVRESLGELDLLAGHNISSFDAHFLNECSSFLPKLLRISIEDVSLLDLKFIVRDKIYEDLLMYRIVPVNRSHAFRYLAENVQHFVTYNQFNYFGINNRDRLLNLLKSIEANKYPHKGKYIILFNGQDIVRDGQHRAAILAHLYGLDTRIKVMRFYFSGNRHIFRKNNNNLKVLMRWVLKKLPSRLRNSVTN